MTMFAHPIATAPSTRLELVKLGRGFYVWRDWSGSRGDHPIHRGASYLRCLDEDHARRFIDHMDHADRLAYFLQGELENRHWPKV